MQIPEMRTYVRDYIDLDSTDLPDSLIDVWLTEAYGRIQDYHHQWPWLSVEGQQYTTTTGEINIYDWRMVTSVRLDDRTLLELPHSVAHQRWPQHTNTTSDKPSHYSVSHSRSFPDNKTLFLWPRPASSVTVFVAGIVHPANWTPASGFFELDTRLLPLLARWALAAAYEREGDLRLAAELRNQFFAELESYKQRIIYASGNEFVGMNDGAGDAATLGRLRYPWE